MSLEQGYATSMPTTTQMGFVIACGSLLAGMPWAVHTGCGPVSSTRLTSFFTTAYLVNIRNGGTLLRVPRCSVVDI